MLPTDYTLTLSLKVNAIVHALTIEPGESLLDVLRERLHLTGTKRGCDHGACGACTVLIDGQSMNACLMLAAMAEGRDVVTIEGLAAEEALHVLQQAFVEYDGLQCGYCTPGQIMAAVGLLRRRPRPTSAEIRDLMSGNLCRCGAYPNIVAAIEAVAGAK